MVDSYSKPNQPTKTDSPSIVEFKNSYLLTSNVELYERIYMYTITGILFIVGWIAIKVVTMFMNGKDRREINTMYKGMKPDRKDWE